MTAEMAIETADQMRPGNQFSVQLKYRWLREADGLLREMAVERAETEEFKELGADRAGEETPLDEVQLLAPPPFDGMYPHYLVAQIDSALGEADRAAGELNQYNALSAAFAGWMRRKYPPKKQTRFRW